MKSTFNVLEFFKNFDKLLEDLRYKELESNYDMNQRLPSLDVDILLLTSNKRCIHTNNVLPGGI